MAVLMAVFLERQKALELYAIQVAYDINVQHQQLGYDGPISYHPRVYTNEEIVNDAAVFVSLCYTHPIHKQTTFRIFHQPQSLDFFRQFFAMLIAQYPVTFFRNLGAVRPDRKNLHKE